MLRLFPPFLAAQVAKVPEDTSQQPGVWVGQIGGIIVVVALILWFVQMRRAPGRLFERRDCERAYASALTPADSLAVDARHPITNRSATDTLTCGALRRSGQLK